MIGGLLSYVSSWRMVYFAYGFPELGAAVPSKDDVENIVGGGYFLLKVKSIAGCEKVCIRVIIYFFIFFLFS